jgi:CheY-like chemotaxis protein
MKSVLLADDNALIRRLLRAHLEPLGVDILEAEDGQAALELARAARPTVVVLDLDMPHLNGFEVCAQLKAREATQDIPVFILTGSAGDDTQGYAFGAGANGFFAKSSDLPALCHVIAKLLDS